MRLKIGLVIIGCALTLLSGCTDDSTSNGGQGDNGNVEPTGTRIASREPREITGTEALKLYGVYGDEENVLPTRTPEYWFPITVWVNASVLPYDPSETIDEVAVYTRETLNQSGTWLGDLKAGTEVTLHSISEDGAKCLVEGTALQGWDVTGWVACNRLDFEKGS